MSKLVVFSLLAGNLNSGFPVVTAQLWDINQPYPVKFTGSLPPSPELTNLYRRWQLLYEALNQRLGFQQRIKVHSQSITNVSMSEFGDVCEQLQNCINRWLNAESFQNIEQQLRTLLNRDDEIRVIFETSIPLLHRLPWHLWNFFEDYRNAEVALSIQDYDRPQILPRSPTGKVKILAILGNSNGIDVDKDRSLLQQLALAETEFLVEPSRNQLNEELWNRDWDILFFAGHSSSQVDGESGNIYINQTDSLTIPQLKNALKTAIARGLKLAIFNSCDGIGLAQNLAALNIPQIIVMREPVPDFVAQEFLKNFLAAFAGGKPFYLAAREARERLQGLENDFPCASWLPVISQNPTFAPVTWQELCSMAKATPTESIEPNITSSSSPPQASNSKYSFWNVLLSTGIVAASLMGLRYVGVLEKWELQVFDQMLHIRPSEEQDSRLLVVEVTEKDIQEQREPTLGAKSISDKTLAQLLNKLQQYQPRVIGVDIYRDIADNLDKSKPIPLFSELNQDNIIAVCKGKDSKYDPQGIKPPEGVPQERQGFTDGLRDIDGIVRRQILMMGQEASSPCTTEYSLSLQLATRYLFYENIQHKFSQDNDYIQFGSTVLKRLKLGRSGAYQQGVNLGGIQLPINYRHADFQRVSISDVLNGRIAPNLVKDKVILIGVTANTTSDTWSTPYSATQGYYQPTPGVLIQAQMVSQVLSAVLDRRKILWVLPYWGDMLCIVGWSVIGGFAVYSLRSLLAHLWGAIAIIIVLYGVCIAVLLAGGLWLPFIPSAFAVVMSTLTVLVLKESNRDRVN
jgi:CHASE2 domain-containing sensor protein